MSNAVNHYSNMQIQTTGLKKLICLIHEKTIFYIKKGMDEGQRRDLEKAQNLIYQLEIAIDRKDDYSDLLAEIYSYCYHLIETHQLDNINQAKELMEILCSTFDRLFRESRKLKSRT
ncbi:MAG: hypothetical protein ACLFQB_01390 [Chitinispirillaceae bacterium]